MTANINVQEPILSTDVGS